MHKYARAVGVGMWIKPCSHISCCTACAQVYAAGGSLRSACAVDEAALSEKLSGEFQQRRRQSEPAPDTSGLK